MGRIVAVLGILVGLAACGVGGWAAARPSLALFVVPVATDIQVAVLGWGEWQIEAQHWSSYDRVEYYGELSRTYSRASSFGVGELWEWAFLTIDPRRPQEVRIRVRQQIAIP